MELYSIKDPSYDFIVTYNNKRLMNIARNLKSVVIFYDKSADESRKIITDSY